MIDSTRFWVGVASREHVLKGREKGFCQLGHGKAVSLNRMQRGDWIVYYSSKERMDLPDPCQRFTAIGELVDEQAEQVEMALGFHPWRRSVAYLDTGETDIHPLIPHLEFIKDKKHWGAPFRFGFLEIQRADFLRIKEAMTGGRK